MFGCKDDVLREKIFKEKNLTLEHRIKICEAHQAYKKQMSVFRKGTGAEHVHIVRTIEDKSQSAQTKEQGHVNENRE